MPPVRGPQAAARRRCRRWSGPGSGCWARSCSCLPAAAQPGPARCGRGDTQSSSGSRCGWPCRLARRERRGPAVPQPGGGQRGVPVLPVAHHLADAGAAAGRGRGRRRQHRRRGGSGTLRYLLAVPAGRARLLGIKYLSVVVFGLGACPAGLRLSLICGVLLFPVGPVTLLSGTTVPLGEGLLRLLFVALYVTAPWPCSAPSGWPSPASPSTRSGPSPPWHDRGGQRRGRHHPAVRGRRPLPAHALVAVVRLAAPRADRHHRPCPTACCRSASIW